MHSLTVISPHQDDAALSLACSLAVWSKTPNTSIRIINCFTISNYSPFASCDTVAEVSALREAEDNFFNKVACEGKLQIVNLGVADSLLRLSETTIERVIEERDLSGEDTCVVNLLRDTLTTYLNGGIFLVPVGVGNHIDHYIASRAGSLVPIPRDKLLYYLARIFHEKAKKVWQNS